MYSLEELTEAEVKSIDLISQKIKYNDSDDVNRVCEYLDNKNRFTSESGKAYLESLRRMCTGKAENTECVFCEQELAENEHIICTSCLRKMLSIKHTKAASENNVPINKFKGIIDKKDKGFLKSHKKEFIIASICLLLILILLSGWAVINHNRNELLNAKSQESIAIDGIDFIGQNRTVADSLFGESMTLIEDNSLYYPASGVSIVFDSTTNIIKYVDCDNNGINGSIQIMGINVGCTKDELIEYFNNMGYECNIADDNTLTVRTFYNDRNLEVYTVLENDIVVLVCVYVI